MDKAESSYKVSLLKLRPKIQRSQKTTQAKKFDIKEDVVIGRVFVFKPMEFVHSDRTLVVWSCGRSKDDQ